MHRSLAALALVLVACHSGRGQCDSIDLDSPVSQLAVETSTMFSTHPEALKGPVAQVLCCHGCASDCHCGADCAPYQVGSLLDVSTTRETYDGYPELSSEYAICQVWSVDEKVKAVWWAPMY